MASQLDDGDEILDTETGKTYTVTHHESSMPGFVGISVHDNSIVTDILSKVSSSKPNYTNLSNNQTNPSDK